MLEAFSWGFKTTAQQRKVGSRIHLFNTAYHIQVIVLSRSAHVKEMIQTCHMLLMCYLRDTSCSMYLLCAALDIQGMVHMY
jgi:hypothetical protein